MKKSLLLLAAFFLTITAGAQNFSVLNAPKVKASQYTTVATPAPKVLKSARKADLADNQKLMGNYTSDTYAASSQGLGLPSYPGTLQAVAYIPASVVTAYVGKDMKAIRYALANSSKVSKVILYGIKEDGSAAEITSEAVTASTSAPGWTTVELSNPWKIDMSQYTALFMGYEYTQSSNQQSDTSYPLSMVSEGNPQDVFIYGNLGQGQGFYNLGSDYGNLSVQAIVEGTFSANRISTSDFGNAYAQLGGTGKVELPLVNTGSAGVSNFDYIVTTDGVSGPEQHYTLDQPVTQFGANFIAPIELPAASATGQSAITITITKVNGVANEETELNVSAGTLYTVSKIYTRRVLVEEFTGTGCGFCPRGLVGMQLMRETYGDRFVGVGLHQYNKSDPMYFANYPDLGFTGAPSCMIDRSGKTTDPYYGSGNSILDECVKALANVAAGDVTLTAEWNTDSTAITATAAVEGYADNADYEVQFVLIGDSLRGNTSTWKQHNYYYQYSAADVGNDPLISQFCAGGTHGTSSFYWAFDDVALASSYANNKNQAPAITGLASGEVGTTSYTLKLPTSSKLAPFINKDKVAVIAILLDKDGNYVNANKLYLNPAAGISNITNGAKANKVVARYNLSGQQVNGAQKGFVIEKYADGTTKKVLVK